MEFVVNEVVLEQAVPLSPAIALPVLHTHVRMSDTEYAEQLTALVTHGSRSSVGGCPRGCAQHGRPEE